MLVYAFELLMKMYEEEGYYKSDIPELIIGKNLYGLEIDERAASLAKFALIMKGMEYDNKLLQKRIEPMIYCFRDSDEVPGFENAKTLGSLISPHTGELEFAVEKREKLVESSNDDLYAISKILTSKFDILLTNPPYVNGGYFNETTKNFITKNYKDFGADLFSVFIVRSFILVKPDGYLGYVTPFVWMFISSYEKLRKELIDHKTIVSLVRPSYHAFFESAAVPLCTFVFMNKLVNNADAKYFYLDDLGYTDDQVPRLMDGIYNPDSKRRFVQKQSNFSKIPGSPIAYWVSERVRMLIGPMVAKK
jgi:type I restriction-modification system DNA methylase subunit